jgi:hypothetical protein
VATKPLQTEQGEPAGAIATAGRQGDSGGRERAPRTLLAAPTHRFFGDDPMTLTTFGSLVGLATGVFTVWDRWLRWRPIAYTVAKTNQGGPYIRIKNVGPIDIVTSRPSTFKIAKGKGDSVKEVAYAMVDKLEPTAIAPQETHDFFFWERRAVDAPRSRSVWFFIYWRKASSTWLWQIPIVLGAQQSTTKPIAPQPWRWCARRGRP